MLDPGFLPLDNLANERPDWREYWPIRRFLQSERLNPDCFYGFLAPRFGFKTGLTSSQISELVQSAPDDCEVIPLSPYSDIASVFWNVFEQGDFYHPGMAIMSDEFASTVGLKMLPSRTANTTDDSVFCNYFLAKPAFWNRWLEIGEALFELAENGSGPTAEKLVADVPYNGIPVPAKVFIMERIASYMLATEPNWKVSPIEPFVLPMGYRDMDGFKSIFITLNALKLSFRKSALSIYRRAFFEIRNQLGWSLPMNA